MLVSWVLHRCIIVADLHVDQWLEYWPASEAGWAFLKHCKRVHLGIDLVLAFFHLLCFQNEVYVFRCECRAGPLLPVVLLATMGPLREQGFARQRHCRR